MYALSSRSCITVNKKVKLLFHIQEIDGRNLGYSEKKFRPFPFFYENALDSSLIHHSLGIDAMRYRIQKNKIQKSNNEGLAVGVGVK